MATGYVIAAVALISYLLYKNHKRKSGSLTSLSEAMVRLADVTERLEKKQQENAAYVDSVPKVLEGILELTKALVESMAGVSRAVDSFQGSLFAKNGDYGKYSDSETQRKNEEYEIQSLMKTAGIPEAAARDRVREANIYRNIHARYDGGSI